MITDHCITCPAAARFKGGTTSREAAEDIEAEGRANRLRELVKSWFSDGNTGTADECAAAVDETILSIRPRVSELRNRGFLVEAGERRPSSTGRASHIWKKAEMRSIGEIALSDVVEPLALKLSDSNSTST